MKLARLVSSGLLHHAVSEIEGLSQLEAAEAVCGLVDLVSAAELANFRAALQAKAKNKENKEKWDELQMVGRCLRNAPPAEAIVIDLGRPVMEVLPRR